MYRDQTTIWAYLMGSLKEQYHPVFWRFDRRHPEVWNLFEQKALKAVRDGKKLYSARRIAQEIRWDEQLRFHMPDPVIAYYARRFISRYPEHRHIFKLKGVDISIDKVCLAS